MILRDNHPNLIFFITLECMWRPEELMGVASLLLCGSSGLMWGIRLGGKHFYQPHKANLKLLRNQKVNVNVNVISTTWMLI